MTFSLASATLLLFIGTATTMAKQVHLLTPQYTIVALVVMGGPSIVLLAIGARAPIWLLRWIWGLVALCMLLLYAGIAVVVGPQALTSEMQLTWPTELASIAGCAAALAWRPRRAVVFALVLFTVLLGLAAYSGDRGFHGMAVAAALRQVFFVSMFMCLAAALLRAGRLLDRAITEAVAETSRQAEQDAKRNSRRTVQMLVHDSIIVALLAYANGTTAARPRQQARQALAAIDRSIAGDAEHGPRLPRDLAWELQSLVTDVDPQSRFDYRATGETPLPTDVVLALTEATSEALRNSTRHGSAGQEVVREVHATLGPNAAQVVILDNGVGFDTSAIPPERLGVRHGILERMNAVKGGAARVVSKHGYGTTVILDWSRP